MMSYRVSEESNYAPIKLTKEVGFGSLANHFLRRCRQKGSDFNLLVIGPAGCGKSTLLANLYQQEILAVDRRRYTRIPNTIEFIEHNSVIQEANVQLRLRVTEALGYGELAFGGRASNGDKIEKILKHVESKHRAQFDRENYAHRPHAKDQQNKRAPEGIYHAALVFIQPQRNLSISSMDRDLLQALQSRINLIPVIAKADSFLPEQIVNIKLNLKRALTEAKVLLFPNIMDSTDDEWVVGEVMNVRSHCPFVTVSGPLNSDDGQIQEQRAYPWGTVNLADPFARTNVHNVSDANVSTSQAIINDTTERLGNDFVSLQKMLIRSHFEFLKRHTMEKLYEIFRTEMIGNVQLAPEAPMRVKNNKSLDNLRTEPLNTEEALVQKVEQFTLNPEVDAEADQEDGQQFFQSTSLDPIREEDESSGDNLNDLNRDKKKKKIIRRMKKSSELLSESKDESVSPSPTIQ